MLRSGRAGGMTLIEVLIASSIFAFAVAIFLTYQGTALEQVDRLEEREMAISRAVSMIEELEAYVEGGGESHASLLDDYDDGTAVNPVLSTLTEVRAPDDPVSGNVRLAGGLWKYTRRITVSKLQGVDSRDVRQVVVTVYRSDGKDPKARVLAEVSRVIRTIGSYMPPTQVVDIYALALENVPGWWVNMTTLKPLVENAFNDMESVNPGLEFRIHWITRVSYGRDPRYAPFVNQDVDAATKTDFAYWYPGVIDESGFTYYSPSQIAGRLNVDGEIVDSSGGEANVPGYTLADQYNAAMRHPDEEAHWKRRRDLGFDREPSLRMLLDGMIQTPNEFRNALIINLHGELLPLPPVRNYSDPARSRRHPGVRVVTHPEKLQYRGHDDVKLRVYSFVTDPDSVPAGKTLEEDIVLYVEGVDVHKSVRVQAIGDGAGYAKRTVTPNASYDGSRTIIRLPASPLRHGKDGERGLAASQRLYGWEYIPAPVEENADFSVDLADSGDRPKNTARWVVTLPGAALPDNSLLSIETRIGSADPTAERPDISVGGSDPYNHSRTYAWIDKVPPPSERAQFQGDPRHMPYSDVKEAHGYNWFFRRIVPPPPPEPAATPGEIARADAAPAAGGAKPPAKPAVVAAAAPSVSFEGWGGYGRTQDGWAVDKVDLDVPRYFALYREALLAADAIFTTMNGFSFFYVGVGGELGSDEPNGYPKGLPLNDKPYGGDGSKTTFVSEIHDETRLVARAGGDGWYARPWVGELFPDDAADEWMRDGNLPAGAFERVGLSELAGNPFGFARKKRTDRFGASAFFNAVGERQKGPFTHLFQNKNVGGATADGRKLGASFNLNTPPSMSAYRPFVLDGAQNYPPEWREPEYVKARLQMRLASVLYDANNPRDAASSALMELHDPSQARSSYFAMNGLSPVGIAGTAFMARYASISLMQGFMAAGESRRVNRVPQLPRITISSPSEDEELIDPTTIHVKWDVAWRRWDGQPYTAHYKDEFVENTPLTFGVKFSTDGGVHWKLARNGLEVPAGERPPLDELVGPGGFKWDVSEMPPGDFLIRVEAYRASIPLHYSYHQVRQNIRR